MAARLLWEHVVSVRVRVPRQKQKSNSSKKQTFNEVCFFISLLLFDFHLFLLRMKTESKKMNKDTFFKNKNKEEGDEKKTEKEVERLQNYLQELTFFLPLAFCKVNSLDYIVVCSQIFQTTTGYQEVELINRPIYFLFKDKGKIENFVIRAISKRNTVETEGVVITKQGKELPVSISVLATTNDKNEFDGYFLTISDITESKRFEQELERRIKERTEELEKAKEKLQESERILEIKVNARTRQLRETAQTLEEKVKERTKILEERTKELERKADTEEKSRTALLNLAEDLEQASLKAQEEKEKTLAIVDNFADALFFFNNNRRAEIINPEAERVFNIKASENIGKSFSELKEKDDGLKVVFESIEEEEGREVFRKEACLVKDVFVEVTSIPIIQNNEMIGVLVDVHDITREKNIEKVKTEFVSLAAHQLRTPLAGIKWTLETVLEEKEEANLPEEIVEFIKKASEANNRMVSLVNDLLNVTRIEEGRYVYEPKNVDMKKVIEASLKEHKEEIEKKGIKFSLTQPEEEVSFVKADEEKLTVVVQNFLDNALKYTKQGEISLKLEELKEGKIRVSISDTGVGIPEEEKRKMFNKFVRGENVQRMDTEGSGLGLFISKNIIEAHKGEIGFDSKEGEGSTFFFTIPVAK
jgi:PAS domain S-box-containing protein